MTAKERFMEELVRQLLLTASFAVATGHVDLRSVLAGMVCSQAIQIGRSIPRAAVPQAQKE